MSRPESVMSLFNASWVNVHMDDYGRQEIAKYIAELEAEIERIRTVAGQQAVENAFARSDLRKQLSAAMRVVNAARDWKHRNTESRGAELVQRVFDAVDAYDKRKEAKRHMELSKVLDDDRDANTDDNGLRLDGN